MSLEVDDTGQVTFWWDCGEGCPPVALRRGLSMQPKAAPDDQPIAAWRDGVEYVGVTDNRWLAMAVEAHMAGTH